jgi:hypothetical protein
MIQTRRIEYAGKGLELFPGRRTCHTTRDDVGGLHYIDA